MWLLDSKTLELKLYYDNAIPHYAILSHVWGENEISFQQINGSRTEIESHAGYIKIQKCCAQAAMDGFEHAWIDTCCIDKTNSAELSEAINSMFKWYRNATECYIYLADITSVDDLWKSRWFTRGWTLQELLAPASAIFFNKDWIEIGTKASLAEKISLVTKIPIRVLLGRKSEGDQELSLAQVMSWAVLSTNSTIQILFANTIREYFNRPILPHYSNIRIVRIVPEYYSNNTCNVTCYTKALRVRVFTTAFNCLDTTIFINSCLYITISIINIINITINITIIIMKMSNSSLSPLPMSEPSLPAIPPTPFAQPHGIHHPL
jgi:Heterokaryon incompatibility protein (HET)